MKVLVQTGYLMVKLVNKISLMVLLELLILIMVFMKASLRMEILMDLEDTYIMMANTISDGLFLEQNKGSVNICMILVKSVKGHGIKVHM